MGGKEKEEGRRGDGGEEKDELQSEGREEGMMEGRGGGMGIRMEEMRVHKFLLLFQTSSIYLCMTVSPTDSKSRRKWRRSSF